MQFRTLHIENFLTIGSATVNLADRGLVLIQGENADDPSAQSNGAGKSSVADALCWCLYGTTARGIGGDDVVNHKAERNTMVFVIVETGENIYRISRYRKHKEHKNGLRLERAAAGIWVDLTEGTSKLTQVAVERVLGCSYEVFKAAVYAGQEQMPDLPAMTDKHLKLLVEEAAGITILERAYDIARNNLNVEKAKREKLGDKIDRQREQLTSRNEDLRHARFSFEAFEEGRAKAVRERLNAVKEMISHARALREKIEAANRGSILSEIEKADSQIKAVEDERETERHLMDEAAKADRALGVARSRFEGARDVVKRCKAEVDSVSERIGQPCGECGRSYGHDDLDEARRLAEKALNDSIKSARALKSDMESAQNRTESVTERLEKHRASMTSISSIQALRDDLSRSLAAIDKQQSEADGLIDRAKRMKVDAEEKRSEPNPHTDLIERIEKECASLEEGLTVLEEADLPEQQIRVEIAEATAKVYGPGGVRAHILDSVTPFLNDRTANYLGALSDGRISATWSTLTKTAKGDLREKFQIDVTNDVGGRSFPALSGGEKRKVRIACALALQDLVASRAMKPIDLFIGDEIDDALDDAGLERLMGVLEEKARERGSVLVISHNSLRDWITNVMIVTKRDGLATIEEE